MKEEEDFNLLIETLSVNPEFADYKEDLLINNLVDFVSYFLIFIGLIVGILVSSLFIKGLYK